MDNFQLMRDHPLIRVSVAAIVIMIGMICSQVAIAEETLDFKINQPDPATEWIVQGLDSQKLGKLEEAIEFYQHAIALSPDDATIYNNMGTVYHQLGQLDLALSHYKKSLFRNPHFTKALNNKGLVYMAKKDWEKAETSFLQAIAADLDEPESYVNLALLYKKMGRANHSLGVLNQVLAIHPRYAPALYYLGQIYEIKGLLLQARITYEQFVRLTKNNALKWMVQRHLQALQES